MSVLWIGEPPKTLSDRYPIKAAGAEEALELIRADLSRDDNGEERHIELIVLDTPDLQSADLSHHLDCINRALFVTGRGIVAAYEMRCIDAEASEALMHRIGVSTVRDVVVAGPFGLDRDLTIESSPRFAPAVRADINGRELDKADGIVSLDLSKRAEQCASAFRYPLVWRRMGLPKAKHTCCTSLLSGDAYERIVEAFVDGYAAPRTGSNFGELEDMAKDAGKARWSLSKPMHLVIVDGEKWGEYETRDNAVAVAIGVASRPENKPQSIIVRSEDLLIARSS